MDLVGAMQGFIVFAIGLLLAVGAWMAVKKIITQGIKENNFDGWIYRIMNIFSRRGRK